MQIPVLALAAFLAQPDTDKVRIDVESMVYGTRFHTAVTQGVLSKTPRWRKDAEHPPLSPRKAIQQANMVKDRLVRSIARTAWFLDSAALVQLEEGQSYWRVQYNGYSTGGISLTPLRLSIIVLMDGTAVEPKVTKPVEPE